MKIYHNQFVIEVVETKEGFIASANREYDCGCSSSAFDNAVDAIFDVAKKASTLRECSVAWRCNGNCPKDCHCPWHEEMEYANRQFVFEYWSSEQNRAEDPAGYRDFVESNKLEMTTKRWLVHYANGRYEDFKEFTDENKAWAFYASMNEDPGCCADEPELEDLPF